MHTRAPLKEGEEWDLDELVSLHFATWSDSDHINRTGLTVALRALQQRPALIVETGTSAWGTDSTQLWASYVQCFGGQVWSVDVRPQPKERLGDLGPSTHLLVDDSTSFLKSFELPDGHTRIDLAYLDSWDLDLADPTPSMRHGLAEWQMLQRNLGPGSVVVIDDTPIEPALLGPRAVDYWRSTGIVPGKGRLVLLDDVAKSDFRILYHHYNVVLIRN